MSGTRPGDMSAAGHRRAAAKERALAKTPKHSDDDRGPANVRPTGGPAGIEYASYTYDPSHLHAIEAARHRRHAALHEKAALTLEHFANAECKKIDPKIRAKCPLIAQLRSVKNDAYGVVLSFAAGTSLEAVLAHMRCHHAFAGVLGYEGMDRCPLYLKDIEMGLTRDGKRVFIHTTKAADASTLVKLRQTVLAHLPATRTSTTK